MNRQDDIAVCWVGLPDGPVPIGQHWYVFDRINWTRAQIEEEAAALVPFYRVVEIREAEDE